MNHKKKKPRKSRAGCKLCKPWKVGGLSIENPLAEKHSDHKRRMAAKDEIDEQLAVTEQVMEEYKGALKKLAGKD